MEHEPVHVVGDIGQGQLRLGACQTSRANEQPVAILLAGDDVLIETGCSTSCHWRET